MAAPKGKAAKQTGQKVPPLPNLLRACEILASAPSLGALDTLSHVGLWWWKCQVDTLDG